MAKVIFNMSMSLDGYISGPNDDVSQLFNWYFSGDTEFPVSEETTQNLINHRFWKHLITLQKSCQPI